MGTRAGVPNTPPSGPPPSIPQSSPNLVHFDPKLCVPQQPVYLQRNDTLFFVGVTNANGAVFKVNYRWMTPEGEIKEGQYTTAPFNLNVIFSLPLYEGWLLSFTARQTGAITDGVWAFLQVFITRTFSPVAPPPVQGLIWQGFVNYDSWNGWPGTPSKEISDGPGMLRYVVGSTPAAGAEISEAVPAQRRWTLLSFTALLTTSVTAASRNILLRTADNSSNIFHESPCYLAQTASTTFRYFLAQQPTLTAPLSNCIAMQMPPRLFLKNGGTIKTSTTNIQAGDQWSAPIYTFLEWYLWDT